VAQCKECSTSLSDGARFCHHCGATVEPENTEVPSEVPKPSAGPPPELDFVRPAITGGAFLGLLSSLPLVSAGNCLCCMWVLGGGAIATLLLSKQQPQRRLNPGDGAFAGVSSGLFGAIIATIVSIPIKILTAPLMQSQQDSIDRMFRDVPSDLQGPLMDLAKRLLSPEVSATTILAIFISDLILYALFAMIGGILMVAYLNNKKSGGVEPPRNRVDTQS
jgi:zinc-ribbon domain